MTDYVILILILILNYSTNVICFNYAVYEDSQKAFDLMTDPTNSYQKWIRPPNDVNDESQDEFQDGSKCPIVVNVSIDLYNYATVDEITSEYTFHLFLDFEWFDPRLKFTPNKENDEDDIIEGGQYHIERIWYPSVFVPNNQEPGSFDRDNNSLNLVRVKHNGYVWMRKRKMLRIYCNMDFRRYPFDQQICSVHFESSIFTVNNMILKWSTNKPFNKAESFRTIGFSLRDYETINTEKKYSKNNTFSRVTLMFRLDREWAHYMFMFYMPSALIVITSWASFWLEITSPPARVTLGVTTMLALVTTFKTTKSQLPTVSYWNALDIWNMVCIVFIFATLVEFACVNYIFNTEKRRRKNKKLQKRLNNRKSDACTTSTESRMSRVSSLESIYTMSSIVEFNRRMSESQQSFDSINSNRRRSSAVELEFNGRSEMKEPAFDLSRRRKSPAIDLAKQMPNIKEEPVDQMKRRRSSTVNPRRMSVVSQQMINENYFKLTPQEFANKIDQKCRLIFPLLFIIFNLLYWTILHINI